LVEREFCWAKTIKRRGMKIYYVKRTRVTRTTSTDTAQRWCMRGYFFGAVINQLYEVARALSFSLSPLFSLSFSSTTTIKSDNKKTCFFLFATLSRALSIMRTNSSVSHASQLKNSDRSLRNKCKKSFSIRIDLKLNVITGLFY